MLAIVFDETGRCIGWFPFSDWTRKQWCSTGDEDVSGASSDHVSPAISDSVSTSARDDRSTLIDNDDAGSAGDGVAMETIAVSSGAEETAVSDGEAPTIPVVQVTIPN